MRHTLATATDEPASAESYLSPRLLRSSPLQIHADDAMTEIEFAFARGGNDLWKANALKVMRRWVDEPRLDTTSRERARTLVWAFGSLAVTKSGMTRAFSGRGVRLASIAIPRRAAAAAAFA